MSYILIKPTVPGDGGSDEDAAEGVADEGDPLDGPRHALHVVADLVHQLVRHVLQTKWGDMIRPTC